MSLNDTLTSSTFNEEEEGGKRVFEIAARWFYDPRSIRSPKKGGKLLFMLCNEREPNAAIFEKLNFHSTRHISLLIRSWKTGNDGDDDTRCVLFVRVHWKDPRHTSKISYFFLPQLSRNIYPPPVYKANLHPMKLLPEPSFHSRQIFFFFPPREIL